MDDTTQQILQTAIAAAVRHSVGILAGSLVTLGWVQSSQQSSFIEMGSGIALGALAYGWSLWQKKGHAAVVAELAALKGNKS